MNKLSERIIAKTDSDAIYDIATGVLSMIHGRYTDDDDFDLVIMTLEAML